MAVASQGSSGRVYPTAQHPAGPVGDVAASMAEALPDWPAQLGAHTSPSA